MTVSVLGAGPHGRQVAALLAGMGHDVRVYDDDVEGLDSCATGADRGQWMIGAAWPQVRRAAAERVARTALCPPLDSGRLLFPGGCLGTDVTVGRHTHVEWNAVISHGCLVGDYVTICPGVVLAGEVLVEREAFIGANATVIHGGITVGAGALVGAGAVVIDDIPPGEVWAGNPARKVADAWDHRAMAQGGRLRARLAVRR